MPTDSAFGMAFVKIVSPEFVRRATAGAYSPWPDRCQDGRLCQHDDNARNGLRVLPSAVFKRAPGVRYYLRGTCALQASVPLTERRRECHADSL
jgi:hypothetical protein